MKDMKKETTEKQSKRREIEAVVVGTSMNKTVRVRVDTVESHAIYKKRIKRKKIYFAHAEEELSIGDKVVIKESRPFSKKIRWVVIKKI